MPTQRPKGHLKKQILLLFICKAARCIPRPLGLWAFYSAKRNLFFLFICVFCERMKTQNKIEKDWEEEGFDLWDAMPTQRPKGHLKTQIILLFICKAARCIPRPLGLWAFYSAKRNLFFLFICVFCEKMKTQNKIEKDWGEEGFDLWFVIKKSPSQNQ